MDQTFYNNLVLLGIGVIAAFNAWQSTKTQKISQEALEISRKTEINTNSMKDALVAATKLASHAEGLAEGRVEGKAFAAEVALNKLTVK